MQIDIQKLITWLEAERSKAHKRRTLYRKENDGERLIFFAGKETAFDRVLTEVENLLSESETESENKVSPE